MKLVAAFGFIFIDLVAYFTHRIWQPLATRRHCFECVGEERKKKNNTDTTTRYYKPSTSFALDQIGIGIEIWD